MDEDLEHAVERTARLARLAVAPDEIAHVAREFGRILDAFRSLAGARTEPPVEEQPGAAAREEPLRDDEPRPFADPASLLALAPEPIEAEGARYFGVPKTVGGAP